MASQTIRSPLLRPRLNAHSLFMAAHTIQRDSVSSRGLMYTSYTRAAVVPEMPGAADPLTTKAREWYNTGLTMWNNDDIPGAIDAFEKSLHTQPNSDAYFNLGNCLYTQGKHESALTQWKLSLDLLPRTDAHVNIANVHAIIKKDLATAVPHYEAALKITPEDGEVHYNYGVVLDAASRLEEAIHHYQQARKLGVEVADKNLRNALAKLIGQKAK
ncbi:hypothetical protein BSLG_008638 [Batrachochytrium salamandrivorans]|nr:hypothetical protein BSLG_008638 [Batrachochytrium salamandrivorans]